MTTPEDPGRTFIGWSADYSCITEDMVIVAIFKEDQPQIDPAIEVFEAAVQAAQAAENDSLTARYHALSVAASALAEITDQTTAKESQAYVTFVACVQAYNEVARILAGDIVRP